MALRKRRTPTSELQAELDASAPSKPTKSLFDPRDKKVMVLGLQGSGKTYLSRELVKRNGLRVLVYTPHLHDFRDEPDEHFLVYQPFAVDNERFFRQAKALAQRGEIDGVLIDEFELVFKNVHELGPAAMDVMANHRHYGMMLIGISRRAQDIPAYIFESSAYVVSFALQAPNAKRKLNELSDGFGDLVSKLDYESREFYVKAIGRAPQRFGRLV